MTNNTEETYENIYVYFLYRKNFTTGSHDIK
jgi:hypothetical protein